MKPPFMVPSDPMDRTRSSLLLFTGITLLSGCTFRRVEIQEGEDPIEAPSGHIKTYPLAEALKARAYYRSMGDTELLVKTLQRIVALAPDQQTLESVLYELGELLLGLEKYEEAQKVLGDYVAYFPGADRIVEARYNELMAHYRDIRAPHHDQTKTREALKRGIAFLDEFEGESNHDQAVRDAITDCYEHIFAHELAIAEFYYHKFVYTESKSTLNAAEKRLEKIYLELGAYLTPVQKQHLVEFEARLRERQKNANPAPVESPTPSLTLAPSDA